MDGDTFFWLIYCSDFSRKHGKVKQLLTCNGFDQLPRNKVRITNFHHILVTDTLLQFKAPSKASQLKPVSLWWLFLKYSGRYCSWIYSFQSKPWYPIAHKLYPLIGRINCTYAYILLSDDIYSDKPFSVGERKLKM